MGQFKPMVKMETTEPSVELKLKKGGKVAKKADGGMMGAPMGAMPPPMPARGGMMGAKAPMRPPLAMRRRAMRDDAARRDHHGFLHGAILRRHRLHLIAGRAGLGRRRIAAVAAGGCSAGEGGGGNRRNGEGEAGAEHAFVPNFLRGQSKARNLHLAIKRQVWV